MLYMAINQTINNISQDLTNDSSYESHLDSVVEVCIVVNKVVCDYNSKDV